jgi:EpsI family protein
MITLDKHAVGGAIAVMLMLSMLVFLHTYQHGEAAPHRTLLREFPMQIESWQGEEVDLSLAMARQLGVSDYTMRIYRNGTGPPVGLYIGYYQSQRQGKTIHSPKNCYPGSGWQSLDAEVVTIDGLMPKAGPVRVNRYLIAKGLEKSLVFYWYHERGRVIASEYWAKFYLMLDAMARHRTDGALVRISSAVSESVPATEKHLLAFMQQVFPFLSEHLPD